MKSLFQMLEEYGQSEHYAFHMPGHKRQLEGNILHNISKIDITEIDGFDNLHDACGIIKDAQERAAAFFHSEESFFLVNGSTGGILSGISACVQPGDWILIARNSHKSVYHGAMLNQLKIAYIYPDIDSELKFCTGIRGDQVKEAILKFQNEHPKEELKAVLITSPTYEGIISDIKEIADVSHQYGIPLIVDEAHGSHLGIHNKISPNSCTQGADLVIHSLHKTMPAMTQCAILHINGTIISRDRLRRYLGIYQTSSPSYVLMASIDSAINIMQKCGSDLFEKFLNRRKQLIQQLSQLQKIHIYDCPQSDPCKLILSTKGTNLTGQSITKLLLERYNLQLEMSAGDYAIAILTPYDTDVGFERLTKALISLDRETVQQIPKQTMQQKNEECKKPEFFMTMGKAIDLPYTWELIENTKGKVSSQFVNAYPPGIPILVPGEYIQQEQLSTIQFLMEQGIELQGVKNGKIKVLELTNG